MINASVLGFVHNIDKASYSKVLIFTTVYMG